MPMMLFQTLTTSIVVTTLACDNQNWTHATSTRSSVPSAAVVSSYPSPTISLQAIAVETTTLNI